MQFRNMSGFYNVIFMEGDFFIYMCIYKMGGNETISLMHT